MEDFSNMAKTINDHEQPKITVKKIGKKEQTDAF